MFLAGAILSAQAQIMSVDLGHEFFKVALMRQGMPLEMPGIPSQFPLSSERPPRALSPSLRLAEYLEMMPLLISAKLQRRYPHFSIRCWARNFTSEADVQSGGPWWKKFGLSDLFYKFDLGYDVERGVPTFKVGEDEAHLLQGEEILAQHFVLCEADVGRLCGWQVRP